MREDDAGALDAVRDLRKASRQKPAERSEGPRPHAERSSGERGGGDPRGRRTSVRHPVPTIPMVRSLSTEAAQLCGRERNEPRARLAIPNISPPKYVFSNFFWICKTIELDFRNVSAHSPTCNRCFLNQSLAKCLRFERCIQCTHFVKLHKILQDEYLLAKSASIQPRTSPPQFDKIW